MGKPRKCTETEAATKVSGRGNMATSMDNEGNPQGTTDSASDLASIRIDHEATKSQLCEIKDLLKKQAETDLLTKEMLKNHIESSSAASKLLESKFDNLSQQIIHATAGVTSLNTRVSQQIIHATAGVTSLNTRVSQQIIHATAGVTSLNTRVSQQIIHATAGVTSLNTRVSQQIIHATAGVTSLNTRVSQQIIHATAGVTSLNTRVQETETKNAALGLEVREVREQLQILQDERRERNIVIEGLPDSDSVYRMGRYVEGMQRPTPVMLKLATMTQKRKYSG